MVSLADLRTAAQQQADRNNSPQLPWNAWVQRSLGDLWDTVTDTYQDYQMKQVLFTLTGGSNFSVQVGPVPNSIATDFNKLRLVERQLGTSGGQPLYAAIPSVNSYQERNIFNGPLPSPLYGNCFVQYLFYGSTIELRPFTSAAGTYQVSYTPSCPTLVQDSDSIDQYFLALNGWDQYVIYDVAAKAMLAEESDPSAFIALADKTKARILKAAAPRDDATPGHIVDVKRLNGNFGFGGGGPNSGWGGFGWGQ